MALTECPHCHAGHVCHNHPGEQLHSVTRLVDEIREAYRQVTYAVRAREEAPRSSTGGILKTTLLDMITRLEALTEAHALVAHGDSYPTRVSRDDVRRHAIAAFGIDLDVLSARVKKA